MNAVEFNAWLDNYHLHLPSHPDASHHRDDTGRLHNLQTKPLLMGILNVTSDSFFDGGRYLSVNQAADCAFKMIADGADLIDIGGESTKPGTSDVPVDLELSRVIPVIEQIRRNSDICISIDTQKPEVMVAAIEAGANVINDINALRTPGALEITAKLKVPVCLMHMQGRPGTMQDKPDYPQGVLKEVHDFFEERIMACAEVGIDRKLLILDPGFGFGKLVKHNLQLVYHLDKLREFNLPLLLGVSRKSTIGAILGKKVEERLIGSISIAIYAALQGVGIIRTHDVDATNQALTVIDVINKTNNSD